MTSSVRNCTADQFPLHATTARNASFLGKPFMKLARQRLYSHCSLVRGRVVVWTVMKLDIYSFCCDLIQSCDYCFRERL